MASFDSSGITPTDLTGYISLLEDVMRDALGQTVNLDSETPQGQLVGSLATRFTVLDEAIVYLANGLNLDTISDIQVDDYGTLFEILKIAGQKSSVTATLSGVAGTQIASGNRARTTSGSIFESTAAVIIGNTGTVNVLFRAVETGPIQVAVGALNSIVDAISGWTGITNAVAAVPGRNVESDFEYRKRYSSLVAVHAREATESIRARVLEVSGVTDSKVIDNDTANQITRQNVDIAARSILTIVEGGQDADVALAIYDTKTPGIPTVGTTSETIMIAGQPDRAIQFTRVSNIPLVVVINLTTNNSFPSTGFATMRQNLLQWFAGIWPIPGPGIFDQSGVGIGESLDTNRLLTPLNAVPGHVLGTVTVERIGGGALGAPDLNEKYTLASADITFVLT